MDRGEAPPAALRDRRDLSPIGGNDRSYGKRESSIKTELPTASDSRQAFKAKITSTATNKEDRVEEPAAGVGNKSSLLDLISSYYDAMTNDVITYLRRVGSLSQNHTLSASSPAAVPSCLCCSASGYIPMMNR